MLISMQGNWTVHVKSKNASFPQRFVISGATSGNGVYPGLVGSPDVHVTGSQWTIAIQNNPGAGFQLSSTQLKFPQILFGNYVFDINSNDAGGDTDFNDLILTCSTPATANDYVIYGHASLYSGLCLWNPCFRDWLVIDRYEGLLKALEIPHLRSVIEKLYPERIPVTRPPFPPPPDPGPFKPLMINLVNDFQIPAKQAAIFTQVEALDKQATKKAKSAAEAELPLAAYKLDRVVTATNVADFKLPYNRSEFVREISVFRPWRCVTEAASNVTLTFQEYDRSASELAGNPYTGTGNRQTLGNAITDMFGNYIFRFQRGFFDNLFEAWLDTAVGENSAVQVRPDIIVQAVELSPVYKVDYETAPYFNIPNLKRIDLCMPKSQVKPASFCFNGNLVGSLGNVFIGGNQNTGATVAALDRVGYNNHLQANGVVSVHNSQAGFGVDCACWGGTVDVRGCMFNVKRNANDPVVSYYTIRFRKPGSSVWNFVTETYLHPKFSKRNLPGYNGDQVGPFNHTLTVDGVSTPNVPAYLNIQADTQMNGVDWEASNLDRYMQLNTAIYQGSAPGTVYFRVDGYDASGNPVAGATDMVALYISNDRLNFGFGTLSFDAPLEYVACGLYKMNASEMRTGLNIPFKANDPQGFVDHYKLSFGKCPSRIALQVNTPASLSGVNTTGTLAEGGKAGNTDAGACPGYDGTLEDFGTIGFVNVNVEPAPAPVEDGWLTNAEAYGVYSMTLTASRRVTNGYNSGIDGTYVDYRSFSIIRK
ncbi:MAG: hypothetical protein WCR52_17205 [Bacteroidota bacterium]